MMNEKENATLKELIETPARFTPEQLSLFLSASQQLIEQTLIQDDPCISE